MSEGCLNEHVYLYFNHPEFPTGAKSKHGSRLDFLFFFVEKKNLHFAKENSLWSFDAWKLITEIYQQPAKKKIINMHSIEIIPKERGTKYCILSAFFGPPSM